MPTQWSQSMLQKLLMHFSRCMLVVCSYRRSSPFDFWPSMFVPVTHTSMFKSSSMEVQIVDSLHWPSSCPFVLERTLYRWTMSNTCWEGTYTNACCLGKSPLFPKHQEERQQYSPEAKKYIALADCQKEGGWCSAICAMSGSMTTACLLCQMFSQLFRECHKEVYLVSGICEWHSGFHDFFNGLIICWWCQVC